MSPFLGQRIVKMEQLLLGHGWSAVEDAGAGPFEQGERRLVLDLAWTQKASCRTRLKNMGEVSLAAARRAVHRQTRARPIRPAVEPRHRRLVARRDQEILVLIGGTVA